MEKVKMSEFLTDKKTKLEELLDICIYSWDRCKGKDIFRKENRGRYRGFHVDRKRICNKGI